MRSILALVAFLLVCPPSLSTTFVDISVFPDWFKTSFKRESQLASSTPLVAESFGVNADVLGTLKLAGKYDTYLHYVIDIGSESPVSCFALTEFDGPANSLHGMVEYAINEMIQPDKPLREPPLTYEIDVKQTMNTPYLVLKKLYALGNEQSSVIGLMKGASIKNGDSLQVCLHNEIGYNETFSAVTQSFFNAFVGATPHDSFFSAAYKMEINNMAVGYTQERYALDADGDIESVSDSSMLMPVDARSVSRSDNVSRAWSRADGSLINAAEYAVENGELSSEFALQRVDDKWQLTGTMQGKDIATALDYSGEVMANYGSYLVTFKLLTTEENAFSAKMWLSEADPTAFMDVQIEQVSSQTPNAFKMEMGPINMDYTADEKGVLQSGVMEQGPVGVKMSLMSVSGAPITP